MERILKRNESVCQVALQVKVLDAIKEWDYVPAMRVKRYAHFLAESAAFRKSVLAAFERGESQAEIGRKFSISRQRVNQIVWPKADKARITVSKHIRSKKMVPANKKRCVDCGKKATAYDHRDYSKPLKVDPVCGACNNKRGQGKNGA